MILWIALAIGYDHQRPDHTAILLPENQPCDAWSNVAADKAPDHYRHLIRISVRAKVASSLGIEFMHANRELEDGESGNLQKV